MRSLEERSILRRWEYFSGCRVLDHKRVARPTIISFNRNLNHLPQPKKNEIPTQLISIL
jgi:hypothetical protein